MEQRQPTDFDVASGIFGEWVRDMRADCPIDLQVDGHYICIFEFELTPCLHQLMTDFEKKRLAEGKDYGEKFKDTGALMVMTRYIPPNYSREALNPYYQQLVDRKVAKKLNKPQKENTDEQQTIL